MFYIFFSVEVFGLTNYTQILWCNTKKKMQWSQV
jgi:hypothetical protein